MNAHCGNPQTVIYLPDPKTKDFESFAAPILNLHDTHVTVPWLGPNACVALVQPVLNGGIPPHHVALELKMTFKDSGAPEFHSKLCVIKERMNEAVANTTPQDETAGGRGSDGVNGVNYESVHLDQLPAYEEALSAPAPQPVQSVAREQNPPPPSEPSSQEPPSESQSQAVPAEPPPGYEEAQRDTVAESLERQLRLHEDRS
ncbi:MAG: hypothetical protein M1831_005422 [Alyxoria varia]|nr:MAG: hypothetical protein M1831_005422 [Alyxoria varia]